MPSTVLYSTSDLDSFATEGMVRSRILSIPDALGDIWKQHSLIALLKTLLGRDPSSIQSKLEQFLPTVVFWGSILITSNQAYDSLEDDYFDRRLVPIEMGTSIVNQMKDFGTLIAENVSGLVNYIRSLPDLELQPLEVLEFTNKSNPYYWFTETYC